MMRRISLSVVTLACCTLSFTAGQLFAASPVSEDFNSNTIGVLVPTGGSGVTDFSGGNAAMGDAGNDGRDWIGTADTDYATMQFTAEVDVTVLAGDNNDNSLYLGLGVGADANSGGAAPGFDEPSLGPSVYVAVRDNGAGNHILGDFDSTSAGDAIGTNTAGPAGPGTHRLQLKYDGSNAIFSIDLNKTGTFELLSSVDTTDNGFDATNSRVFIGSSNGRVFDNFDVFDISVIPQACDVNENGVCNSSDFAVIRDNLFGFAGDATRADGDLTGDGNVDLLDYRRFKDDPVRVTGFDALSGVAIPEPGTATLLVVTSLCLAGASRRRS